MIIIPNTPLSRIKIVYRIKIQLMEYGRGAVCPGPMFIHHQYSIFYIVDDPCQNLMSRSNVRFSEVWVGFFLI